MSADKPSNEPASATTPENAAPSTPPRPLTEAEFLEQQAREARQAIARMASLIGKNVGHGVDPRVWTRAHPWTALGAAVVGGFAAINVVPSHDERELHHRQRQWRRRRSAWRRRLAREFDKAGFPGWTSEHQPGVLQRLIHEVVQMVRPIVFDLIYGLMRGPAGQPEPASNGNDGGLRMEPQPQPQQPPEQS